MKLINFTAPRPQFSDVNGDPLALGRVTFYEAGTTTLKTVYSDADKTATAPNPHELDAGGFVQDGGVWLDDGRYKILVEKSDGAGGWIEEYTIDDVPGTPGVPSELTGAIIGTIADLRLLDPGAFGAVFITGYYEVGDRGEGWFVWDENSNAVDNGGTVISPNGAPSFGRWKRLIQQTKIIPQIFGAMTETAFGVSSNMQSLVDWCNESGNEEYTKLRLDPGSYFVDGSVGIDGQIDLEVADGVVFDNHPATSGTVSITCKSAIIETKTSSIVGDDITLIFNPTDMTIRVNNAWFGSSDFALLDHILSTSGLNRDWDVYTTLEIENGAVGVLNFPDLYFFNNAVFNIISTSALVNINTIISLARNTFIFPNQFSNVRIAKGEIFASWFNFSDSFKFEDMLECITDANTRFRNLKWDSDVVMSGGNTTNYKVNHDFTYGGSVSCSSGTIRFQSITAGKIKIFDENATGFYEVISGTIKPEWFGAMGYDFAQASQNVISFNKMFANWVSSSLAYIDGDGVLYSFNSQITYAGPFTTLRMRNIQFLENTLVAGTFFSIDGAFNFENISFETNATNIIDTNAAGDYNQSFINCKFVGGGALNRSVDVKGPSTHKKMVTFSNCRFENAALNCRNATVLGCYFLYSNIVYQRDSIFDSTFFVCKNNTFQSKDLKLATIEIDCLIPNSKIMGLVVTGNIWIDLIGEITASYKAIDTTNADINGHNADVYDNTNATPSRFSKIPTTRPKGVREFVGAASPFNITLNTNPGLPDEVFLPLGTAPIAGYVCGAGQWQGATTGLLDVSFNNDNSNGAVAFPNVKCEFGGSGLGNDIVVTYEFINSTNEKLVNIVQ